MQTHIFEAGTPDYPAEIGSRFWHSMAQAETSVNLPFYGNITDTHPFYKRDIIDPNENLVTSYVDDCAYWLFAATGRLARGDRRNYAAPIKDFWRAHELKLFEDQEKVIEPELLRLYKEVSPAESAKFITDYTIAVSDRTFRAAAKIHDALVAHIAAAPNTLFKIPADLLEPTINETALRTPTDEDKKAADGAQGSSGHSLLTRDDGNIQVNPVSASDAPKIDGYNFNNPGAAVSITLKPEQITAKQNSAKLLYEAKITADSGKLDKLKSNLAFVMSVGGKTLKLVGPDSGALISFPDALSKGIATLTLTSDGAIVTLEYILTDASGNPGIHNNKLVVCDGDANGALNGSIWVATSKSIFDSGEENGCDAGFGFAALGLLGILLFVRKRSK
jgi:hypothetical protein